MSVLLGSQIIHLEETDSTNRYALDRLQEQPPPPEGTVITSSYQHQGRGQQGNYWESEAGRNLLFSIILYPHVVPPDEMFNLSKAVSLGLADFLSAYFYQVSIKWPNDIYIQDDKVAGILIENSLSGNCIDYSVVGIGLNVNQTMFYSQAPNPTSMKLRGARHFALSELLPIALSFIETRYLQLFTDFSEQLDSDYLQKLYRYNTFHTYKAGKKAFIAKITGVDSMGHLLLQTQDGEKLRYYFKEITFV